MRPSALPPLADKYCTAINALLRRELHAYTSELRRMAGARMATAPPEPDILKGFKKVRMLLLFLFPPGASNCRAIWMPRTTGVTTM